MPDGPQQARGTPRAGLRRLSGLDQGRQFEFPDEKHYALLQEILRYCAAECLLVCCYSHEYRLQEIADMLDAAYPRYARTRERLFERGNRYGRPRF